MCVISGIYNASLKTRIQFRPLAEVYPVAAKTIGTSFIGVYVSENGDTSQLLFVHRMMVQFLPATVVSACESISHLPWIGCPLVAPIVRIVDDTLLSDVLMYNILLLIFSCNGTMYVM